MVSKRLTTLAVLAVFVALGLLLPDVGVHSARRLSSYDMVLNKMGAVSQPEDAMAAAEASTSEVSLWEPARGLQSASVLPVPTLSNTIPTVTPAIFTDGCTVLSEEIEYFSSGNTEWTNGKIDSVDGFGQFLGRYGKSDAQAGLFPSREYKSHIDANKVILEFDFLEVDSWDADQNGPTDYLEVELNGINIVIGYYDWKIDDGTKQGELNGIKFISTSNGVQEHLIGNTKWPEQSHHVSIEIPANVFPARTLLTTLKIHLDSSQGDESGGFDNIKYGSYLCPDPTPPPAVTPVDPNNSGGVNGDPLIMGRSGQLFKFDGRNGAWYSAVSSKSFQWNMKISEYADCPADSNKFVSGVGFTVFKKTKNGERAPMHKIAVNVVNEFGVQTGCGTESTNCLANGSVELIIDDKKFVYPGDYQFKDGTGRVVAFNTYYECSRKWYDFDITPASDRRSRKLRRLNSFPGVFDVVRKLEDTMVDKGVCDAWITERQKQNDLFKQAGEWSTIIVKTEQIAFHIEYKQEHKRCDAHTVDVWISSVSPDLYDEDWEGVIGETKDPVNHGGEKVDRVEFLKFPNDDQYEVVSPFEYKCDGCYKP